jgi:hypothetical protein
MVMHYQNTLDRAGRARRTQVPRYPRRRRDRVAEQEVTMAAAGALHPGPADENKVRQMIGFGEVEEKELQTLFDAEQPKLAVASEKRLPLTLAADLLESHDETGISLYNWKAAREFVERQLGQPILPSGV